MSSHNAYKRCICIFCMRNMHLFTLLTIHMHNIDIQTYIRCLADVCVCFQPRVVLLFYYVLLDIKIVPRSRELIAFTSNIRSRALCVNLRHLCACCFAYMVLFVMNLVICSVSIFLIDYAYAFIGTVQKRNVQLAVTGRQRKILLRRLPDSSLG